MRVAHDMGAGFREASDWLNDRCNNSPELLPLRREWSYAVVTERIGRQ